MVEAMAQARERASTLDGLSLPAAAGVAHLVEAPMAARFVFRALPEAAKRLFGAAGLGASVGINRAVQGEAATSLQLGPDEWLLLAATGGASELAASMDLAADGVQHALVDVTDRSTSLTLDGPQVEDVLAAGCPLPLDIEAFAVGRATRTLWSKAEIVLWRQEPHRFHIETARSYAPYLVASLAQAIAAEAALMRCPASARDLADL